MDSKQIEETLKQFCSTDRERLQHIYNDGSSVVATDGSALAWLQTHVYPDITHIGSQTENYPDWKKVIPADEPVHTGTIATDELRTNPEPPPEARYCHECDGSGAIEHECDCRFCEEEEEICPACDGVGTFQPHHVPDLVSIGSRYYNAEFLNRIADLMAALQINEVFFHEHENGIGAIYGTGVLCLIMPVMIFPNRDCPNNIIHRIELESEAEGATN